MIDSTKLGTLPTALAPLISKNNWVLWKSEIVNNKPTKVPFQPNNRKASTTKPATWSSYAAVIAALDALPVTTASALS
jgi:primase-polymerase (primpol)-like protein